MATKRRHTKAASYKTGAMSATDAVRQLKQAAKNCDRKWVTAHVKSARFFGATEQEIGEALRHMKCGTNGVGRPRKRARRKPAGTKGLCCPCDGSSSSLAGLDGGCMFIVESGNKRRVRQDLASAKSAAKRLATKTKPAKVLKACSSGRGARATFVARCTPKKCK